MRTCVAGVAVLVRDGAAFEGLQAAPEQLLLERGAQIGSLCTPWSGRAETPSRRRQLRARERYVEPPGPTAIRRRPAPTMTPITREQFLRDRAVRRGTANPERIESPVWTWLVETRLSAYRAARTFDPDGSDSTLKEGSGPGFCFDRMGCPAVDLPDGRRVWVAGEHEDHYDPDFYIYNDVIAREPDGSVVIYAYPEDVFAPTDFHSATFDPSRRCVWIVGNLGPVEAREPDRTPVYTLDLDTFAIESVETTGDAPGWIHGHTATISGDGTRLTVSRGIRVTEEGRLIDQTDSWSLDLDSRTWTRDTHRPYRQWSIERTDGEPLSLFEMEMLRPTPYGLAAPLPPMSEQVRQSLVAAEVDPQEIEETVRGLAERERSATANFDPNTFESLYVPPVEHRRLDDALADSDDENRWNDNTRFDSARLEIEGCVVRYAEESDSVELKIEGALPGGIEDTLRDDLVAKLSRLHGVDLIARLVADR